MNVVNISADMQKWQKKVFISQYFSGDVIRQEQIKKISSLYSLKYLFDRT